MREWINLIAEGFYNDDDQSDWRAWITEAGEVLEVPGDETHAEFMFYRGEYDLDIDEGPDKAFDDAMDRGWIRIGVRPNNEDFIANFFYDKTTRAALTGLLGLTKQIFADRYFCDDGVKVVDTTDTKVFARHINKMIAKKGR